MAGSVFFQSQYRIFERIPCLSIPLVEVMVQMAEINDASIPYCGGRESDWRCFAVAGIAAMTRYAICIMAVVRHSYISGDTYQHSCRRKLSSNEWLKSSRVADSHSSFEG